MAWERHDGGLPFPTFRTALIQKHVVSLQNINTQHSLQRRTMMEIQDTASPAPQKLEATGRYGV